MKFTELTKLQAEGEAKELGLPLHYIKAIQSSDDLKELIQKLATIRQTMIEYYSSEIRSLSDDIGDLESELEHERDQLEYLKGAPMELFNELSFKAGVQLDPYSYLDQERIIKGLSIAAKLSPVELLDLN